MTDDIIAHVGIYGAAFVIGLVSSVVPLISAEVFVATIVIATTQDPVRVIVLGTIVAVGQIAAKVPMYYGARGATRLAHPSPDGRLARTRRWIERWRASPIAFTLVSAVTGIPPFYFVALLAGMLELPFGGFLAVGLVGRVVRFVAIGLLALSA
jgi:membrane protein YqaA with SNARE-associated domain